MSDFHKTRMGHRFYEHTMPELVKQMARLTDLLEGIVRRMGVEQENKDGSSGGDDCSRGA